MSIQTRRGSGQPRRFSVFPKPGKPPKLLVFLFHKPNIIALNDNFKTRNSAKRLPVREVYINKALPKPFSERFSLHHLILTSRLQISPWKFPLFPDRAE
jgi:hypothetical protein